MSLLAKILIGLIALEHIYILYIEMFAWTSVRTRRIFGTTPEFAEATKVLAANQGLYNGFLAFGLILSLLLKDAESHRIAFLFLSFVFLAGLFGGTTANRRILYVQALPAVLALIVLSFFG